MPSISISNSNVNIGGRGNQAGSFPREVAGNGPNQPSGSRVARVGAFVVGSATVIATVVAVATYLNDGRGGGTHDPAPTPAASRSATTGTQSPIPIPPRPIEARIVDTWEVSENKYVGVRTYSDPSPEGRGTENGRYPENHRVFVLCKQQGREIKDAPWKNRPLSTTTWYRLTGSPPEWVPDMYVRIADTEKTSAADVPSCA